jgi:hypothetical protein
LIPYEPKVLIPYEPKVLIPMNQRFWYPMNQRFWYPWTKGFDTHEPKVLIPMNQRFCVKGGFAPKCSDAMSNWLVAFVHHLTKCLGSSLFFVFRKRFLQPINKRF